MDEKKVPFFARFLEDQGLPKVKSNVKGGRGTTTLKYPSDRDEYVTMKYPSDDDEGGIKF
jgi:hypothetical protein